MRGITPWFERVDSDLNISDLPTRDVELPVNCESTGCFLFGETLLEMVKEGFSAQLNGFFDPEELVGRLYTPPMFSSGRGIIDQAANAVRRTYFFTRPGGQDSYDWLMDRPDVQLISQLPNDNIPAMLASRILSRQTYSAVWSIPVQQLIDFETPSQILGIEGLLLSPSVIYNLAFRTRALSYPMPDYNYPPPDPAISVGDSISIAFIFQRMTAGRVDGYTLSGSSFLWKASDTLGIAADGAGAFPQTDDLMFRFPDRHHVRGEDLITDLRRFYSPLGIFFRVCVNPTDRSSRIRIPPDLFPTGSNPGGDGCLSMYFPGSYSGLGMDTN